MSQAAQIANILPYHHQKKLVESDHNTNDIVKCIKKYHPIHAANYDKISGQFWRGNVESTTRGLFKFLKNNVTYDVEPEDYQTVKSPGAIMGHGYGDCKHYASFITGVCDSLQRAGHPIKSKYRFVSDSPDVDIHHVFAVVSGQGAEYWCDPVLNNFDKRPTFYNIKDSEMSNNMGALYHISGTNTNLIAGEENEIGKIKLPKFIQAIAHGFEVNAANVKKGIKVNTANIEKGIKVNADNLKKMALKVSLAPARNAFLAITDVNALNLANKLRVTLKSGQRNALLRKWQNDLGGDPQKLINAVNNGYRHYKKGHGGYIESRDRVSGHIGEPVTTGTLIALATAIIAALGPFLHNSTTDQKEQAQAAENGVKDLAAITAQGLQAASTDSGSKALEAITQPGSGTGSMSISAGVAADGTPTMTVNSIDHPAVTNAGAYKPGPDDVPGGGGASTDIVSKPGQYLQEFGTGVITFIQDNKVFVGLTVVGVVAYKVATRKKRR